MSFAWQYHFGVDYAAVQARLNALGASPPLTVDGINGPLTRAAVVAFQEAHGLSLDGAVGPLTLAALGLSSSAPSPGASRPGKGDTVARVKGIEKLSPSDLQALSAAAAWIGIPTSYLANAISFETGGTFSPAVQNPSSHATGLIQFLPSTAANMGTSIDALRMMTFSQQLEYVKAYFARWRGQLHSMADVYLAIFYPAAISKAPSDVIAEAGSATYDQNAGFDAGQKGYITREDITSVIEQRLNAALALGSISIPAPVIAGGIGAMLLALGGMAFWLFRKGMV